MYQFKTFMAMLYGILFLTACTPHPQAIRLGQDNCDFCQMTISDPRFGGEIITQKGRVYKFDDLHCLKGFLKNNRVPANNIYKIILVDFTHPGNFIPAEKAYLLENKNLESPMGSATAAFEDEKELKKYQSEYSGKENTWKEFVGTN